MNKTINVWWINHHATPPVVPGSTRHFALAKSLHKYSINVTIINGSFDHLSPFFVEGKDFGATLKQPIYREYDGIGFYSIPTPAYAGTASLGRIKNMFCFYLNALKYLPVQKALTKPDIIIGSTVHPLAALAGYKLAKQFGVPFVYEVRDLWPQTLIDIGRISSQNPIVMIMSHIDQVLAKNASLIIATAPKLYVYYMQKYGILPNKFVWITNGTTLVDYAPQKKTICNAKIKVGYFGAIGLANGLGQFLKQLTLIKRPILSHFIFDFIGDGPLKEKLECFAEQNNLPVSFKNAITKDEVWDAMEEYDILLFSLIESKIFEYGISPNKLADYHATGRPILEIVNIEDSPTVQSKGGLHINNLNELSDVLDRITHLSQGELDILGKNARSYAEKNYNWDKLALKLSMRLKEIVRI